MRLFSIFLPALLVLGCQSSPADVREWTPADHDHTTNPNATQVEVAPGAESPLAAHGIDEVTIVAWKRNCATCHGAFGAGDGPQGRMTGTRDLTSVEWQTATTDEAISRAIREGRGRMPAFTLPDSTVQSLVRLVRLFDARGKQEPTKAAPATDRGSP